MSLKSKFLLVFILITILASILGFQLLKSDQLANLQRERYYLSNRQIILALELKSRLILAVKDVVDSFTIGEEELEEYQKGKVLIHKIVKDLTQVTKDEDIFTQSHDKDNREEEIEQFKKLKHEIAKQLKFFDNLIETKTNQNESISKVIFKEYFEKQFEQNLVPQIDEFIQGEKKELEEIKAVSIKKSHEIKELIYLIWGISFLTFIVIFTTFYRSIATPLSQLKQAATQVGEKDFSFNLKISENNELGAVAKAFQTMERKIKTGFENIESLFKLIVENSNDAIISIDSNGKIISWNKGAEQIYGYAHDEVMGKPISILTPENLKNEPKNIIEKIKNEKVDLKLETKRITKDGRILDISLSLNPIMDSDSNFIGVSSISRDISEIKIFQETLIQARNEAEIANKSKSEFLSRMSHEFRTPLNSILGFSQILNSETKHPLNESQKEKINCIINSGNHILKLVNGLLDLTAIEKNKLPIKIGEVSLNQLLDESFNQVKESALEKKLRIIDNIPANKEIWIASDSFHLKKVLLNLFANAIKYNKEGGSIEIAIEVKKTKTALLKISDTGVGIPEEKRDKIFQPFNAINPQASFEEGVGLGLSISKIIIGMMEGKLFFESHVGKGSSFFIELPFVKEKTISPENMNGKPSSIKTFNSNLEKETDQEIDLSKITIPNELRVKLLDAAEIYNYTKLESLINELQKHGEGGRLVAELSRKYLHQYDVDKIIEVLDKTG